MLVGTPTVTERAGRAVATPPGFESIYRVSPETTLGPFVFNKPQGYQFELSWVAGEFGLRAAAILYADTRYILKVVYSSNLVNSNGDEAAVLRAVVGNASGGVISRLPDQPIERGSGEAVWVMESERDYPTVGIEVVAALRWATYEGHVRIERIEMLVAPPLYGEDAVHRIHSI